MRDDTNAQSLDAKEGGPHSGSEQEAQPGPRMQADEPTKGFGTKTALSKTAKDDPAQ